MVSLNIVANVVYNVQYTEQQQKIGIIVCSTTFSRKLRVVTNPNEKRELHLLIKGFFCCWWKLVRFSFGVFCRLMIRLVHRVDTLYLQICILSISLYTMHYYGVYLKLSKFVFQHSSSLVFLVVGVFNKDWCKPEIKKHTDRVHLFVSKHSR